MIFQYRSKAGRVIERDYPPRKNGPPKAVIERGVRYTRIYTPCRIDVRDSVAHVSSSLPLWTPGADDYVRTGPKRGRPIVKTRKAIKRIEDMSGGRYVWDGDVS